MQRRVRSGQAVFVCLAGVLETLAQVICKFGRRLGTATVVVLASPLQSVASLHISATLFVLNRSFADP
jgi:hypothetical protein